MSKAALTVVAMMSFLVSACASTRTPGTGSSFGDITSAQIEATTASDAYQVIQDLRPSWLRQRGAATINRPTPVVVYQDNVRVGGLEALRDISAASIRRISFLDSQDATQRFGTGHVNGAILIFTR